MAEMLGMCSEWAWAASPRPKPKVREVKRKKWQADRRDKFLGHHPYIRIVLYSTGGAFFLAQFNTHSRVSSGHSKRQKRWQKICTATPFENEKKNCFKTAGYKSLLSRDDT